MHTEPRTLNAEKCINSLVRRPTILHWLLLSVLLIYCVYIGVYSMDWSERRAPQLRPSYDQNCPCRTCNFRDAKVSLVLLSLRCLLETRNQYLHLGAVWAWILTHWNTYAKQGLVSMSQCFTSPNYWGYNIQRILEGDVRPITKKGHLPTPAKAWSKIENRDRRLCSHHLSALNIWWYWCTVTWHSKWWVVNRGR